jgi:outer membrane receptor for monomeric catechols
VMKVGGNESATKYFQSHGGSAALASKDPKTKYTSTAAVKYKEELKRRAAADAQQSVPSTPIPAICYGVGGMLTVHHLGTPTRLSLRIFLQELHQMAPALLPVTRMMTFSHRGTSPRSSVLVTPLPALEPHLS